DDRLNYSVLPCPPKAHYTQPHGIAHRAVLQLQLVHPNEFSTHTGCPLQHDWRCSNQRIKDQLGTIEGYPPQKRERNGPLYVPCPPTPLSAQVRRTARHFHPDSWPKTIWSP